MQVVKSASSRKGPEGHGHGGEEPGRETGHLHSWERLRLEAEIRSHRWEMLATSGRGGSCYGRARSERRKERQGQSPGEWRRERKVTEDKLHRDGRGAGCRVDPAKRSSKMSSGKDPQRSGSLGPCGFSTVLEKQKPSRDKGASER